MEVGVVSILSPKPPFKWKDTTIVVVSEDAQEKYFYNPGRDKSRSQQVTTEEVKGFERKRRKERAGDGEEETSV